MEAKRPVYHGRIEEEFHLLELYVEAAPLQKGYGKSIRRKTIWEENVRGDPFNSSSLIGDGPLQCIRDCDTAKAPWDELQHGYAEQKMADELGALNSFHEQEL